MRSAVLNYIKRTLSCSLFFTFPFFSTSSFIKLFIPCCLSLFYSFYLIQPSNMIVTGTLLGSLKCHLNNVCSRRQVGFCHRLHFVSVNIMSNNEQIRSENRYL